MLMRLFLYVDDAPLLSYRLDSLGAQSVTRGLERPPPVRE